MVVKTLVQKTFEALATGTGAGQQLVALEDMLAMLFEELELSRIEQEFDRLPILKAPALRDPA